MKLPPLAVAVAFSCRSWMMMMNYYVVAPVGVVVIVVAAIILRRAFSFCGAFESACHKS